MASQDLSQPLLASLNHPPDYYSLANPFSKCFFNWTAPILRLGHSRPLVLKDVPSVPSSCQSHALLASFLQSWDSQKKSGIKPSVRRALTSCFWKQILWTATLALVKGLGTLSGPVFLYFFTDYATGNILFDYEGIVLVVALFVVKILENLAQRHWYFGCRVLGTQIQSAVMAAVYQKELRLSSIGKREHSTGEIVNYISVDAFRLCEAAWRLHWAWLVPVMLVSSIAILYAVVGWASIPAMILIVAVILMLTPLIKLMQGCHLRFMVSQDERLRATSEILLGMKVIKLQAWEEKFNSFIHSKRDVEFKWLAATQQYRHYTTIINWITPIVLTCVVLITCLFLKTTLTSTLVFTVLSTFRIIQDPIRMTPEMLSALINAQVAFGRLDQFLQEDELSPDAVSKDSGNRFSEYAIRVDSAVLSWIPEQPKPTLRDINLVVRRGEKVAVCGAVGSGKSTLLYSILGEIPKLSGSIHLSGTIAYVAQTAWIQTMTVRDNILFGKPYDPVRYKKTIRACALEEDMKSFSHGDQTEIGERGINMSGGQKQRIQLARAVYNDADIYLLDDPFSAVDAQTAAVLFHDCVMGALRDKTVVLVTHQIEFLPSVDTILVMQDGEIKQAGKYDDLLIVGAEFENLVSAHQAALHSVTANGDSEALRDGQETQMVKIKRRLSREGSIHEEVTALSTEGSQLVEDEATQSGKVGLKLYVDYIRIPKAQLILAASLIGQVIFSVAQLYSNLWLARGVSNTAISSTLLIQVFAGVSLLCMAGFYLRSQMLVIFGLRASKTFFNGLMDSIMKAPMSFFDSTPSGRILNRVSVDMSMLDLDIPFGTSFLMATFFDIACIIVVTAVVTWKVLIIIIPVLVYTQYLQRYYAETARELNRINSTTKAPIVNNSAETISGAATIRAFNVVERFERRNLQLIDKDASAYIYKFGALEWMIIRIELSCTAVLIVTSSLVLWENSTISAGLAGLAITYALALSMSLSIFMIWQSFLSIYMVSVERIKQYLHLPTEAPAVIESHRPPPHWPTKGKVAFQNLKIRYRDNSPLVLKGITCTFLAGQKVGVVGRTGSGKTTLISALFRLVEPCEGQIFIDDVNILEIGLHDLRFKLGIIPQEPVLFQGTVRTNLDPLNQYNDFEIWETLKKCQLADIIRSLPLQLESPVSDQGENWSAGQRQLFCLGRVLLKQSQVLVLDEATASIDSATDALLQRVIREEFMACTVITVAHRIPTVIDSDMVLALRDGFLMEFAPPTKLIENRDSLFANLVAEYWAQAGRNSSSTDKLSNHK